MCKRINKNISGLLVLRDHSGLFYVGQIRLDPDGLIEPYSKVSDLCSTIEEANEILAEMQNGREDV